MESHRIVAWAGVLMLLAGCSSRPECPGGTFDAGAVFANETPTLLHRFLVKNSTGRTVRILGERHSCTCTDVQLANVELRPGESTTLSMSVRVPFGYAKSDVEGTVLTDHPVWPEWPYHLRFESYPSARIIPERIDLGDRLTGSTGGSELDSTQTPSRAWLEVYAPATGPPPAIGKAQVPLEIAATIDPRPILETLSGGVRRARYAMTIGCRSPQGALGTFVRTLSIPVGDVRAEASVIWSVRGPFSLSPSQVHFGMVSPGAEVTRRVTIRRSTPGPPFGLQGARNGETNVTVHRPFEATWPAPPADVHVIDLVFKAPEPGGVRSLEGRAALQTDSSELGVVSVPWSAFLRSSEE